MPDPMNMKLVKLASLPIKSRALFPRCCWRCRSPRGARRKIQSRSTSRSRPSFTRIVRRAIVRAKRRRFRCCPTRTWRRRRRPSAKSPTSHIMPPWKAEPASYAYRDERRLTDEQIALIQAWVDEGMPEGNAAEKPEPPKFASGWQLGRTRPHRGNAGGVSCARRRAGHLSQHRRSAGIDGGQMDHGH